MKLFFDNNISPRVPRAIHQLISPQDEAVALRDKFAVTTTDIEWITQLSAEGGWSVVSADLRISRNKAEKAAWLATDLVGFFLEPSLARLDPVQQAARLLYWIPVLEDQLAIIRGPALFSLPLRATSRLRQI